MQAMAKSPALQKWTAADWLLGLTVMAHHNTKQQQQQQNAQVSSVPAPTPLTDRRSFLDEMLRFVRICNAVYADTVEQFAKAASVPVDAILRCVSGGLLAPKFLLLKNDETKEIVLVVRGTASILDFCTDICLVNEPFGDGQGHRGMVHSAKWLVKNVKADLERLTTENPEYQLVITGHSLGAGVSALTAMELKPSFPSLKCIAFATPASVTENLAHSCQDYVTTVVNGDDCVPRLHQHSMLRLQGEVSKFDWRATLKQMVDEEVEEQKSMVKRKRDEHIQQAYEAFQRLKESQEQQAQAKLMEVLSTPVGQRVSTSLEATKAAFGSAQSTSGWLVSAKEVVQKQKKTGDDNMIWGTAVAGMERLANSVSTPDGLIAKGLGLLSAPRESDGVNARSLPWTHFHNPIKAVVNKATDSLKVSSTESTEEVHVEVQIEETETAPDASELLDEPPFPPGRIVYLTRLLHDASEDAVELVDVVNTEFNYVVLSSRMVRDHLCSTYERVLRAAAGAIERLEHVDHGDPSEQ